MFAENEILIAFIFFATVSSITPGPSNVMLLTSGANFGFKRSIPHICGATIGFSVMLLLIGLGLSALFVRYEIIYNILCYICIIYLPYLAWQIMRSSPVNEEISIKKPMTFFQASLLQWVNPKAWFIGIASITTYIPEDGVFLDVLAVAVGFAIFVAPCSCIWAAFGTGLRHYLRNPLHLKIFNIIMAILLLVSMYPLVLDILS